MMDYRLLWLFLQLQASLVTGQIKTINGCNGQIVSVACNTTHPIKIYSIIYGRPLNNDPRCTSQSGDCELPLDANNDPSGLFKGISVSCAKQPFCQVRTVETLIENCELPTSPVTWAFSKYMVIKFECIVQPDHSTTAKPTSTTQKPVVTTTKEPDTTTTAEPSTTTQKPVVTTTEPDTTTTQQEVTTTEAEKLTTTDPGDKDTTTQPDVITTKEPDKETTQTSNNTTPIALPVVPPEERDWLLGVIIGSIVVGGLLLILLIAFLVAATRSKSRNDREPIQPKNRNDISLAAVNGAYINGYDAAPLPVTDPGKVDRMTSYHKKMEIDVDALYGEYNPPNGNANMTNGHLTNSSNLAAAGAAGAATTAVEPTGNMAAAAAPSTMAAINRPRTAQPYSNNVIVSGNTRPQTANGGGRFSQPVSTGLSDNNLPNQPILTPADGDLYYAYHQGLPEQDYCFYGDLYPQTDIDDI